jgi:hypothetical protein
MACFLRPPAGGLSSSAPAKEHPVAERLLRLRAERLPVLWCVDTRKAHAMLRLGGVEHHDRVAVHGAHDFAGKLRGYAGLALRARQFCEQSPQFVFERVNLAGEVVSFLLRALCGLPGQCQFGSGVVVPSSLCGQPLVGARPRCAKRFQRSIETAKLPLA